MANLTPSSCKTLSGYFVFFLPSTLLPFREMDGMGMVMGMGIGVKWYGVEWIGWRALAHAKKSAPGKFLLCCKII